MITGTAAERGSTAGDLTRQLAVDLRAAADARSAVAVLLRFIDDRSAALRKAGTRSTQAFLDTTADGMCRVATELDEAARAAWGDLAPHVPQPPRPVPLDDSDLDAFEEADRAREAGKRALGRLASAATDRRQQRRKS